MRLPIGQLISLMALHISNCNLVLVEIFHEISQKQLSPNSFLEKQFKLLPCEIE